MSTDADERAKGVDLPPWWLEKIRELVDERKDTLGENLTQLGRSLAAAVGRDDVWDHSSVSRFLRNKNTTMPMAEAFAQLLGVPRPFFVPRSLEEAIALTATAKRYEAKLPATEQSRQLAGVDALVDRETRGAVLDRSRGAAEDDRLNGKTAGGGRSRRIGRRRPPPARS